MAAVSVADLSCGNAEIARGLGVEHVVLGDYAPGYQLCGPIEETVEALRSADGGEPIRAAQVAGRPAGWGPGSEGGTEDGRRGRVS